MFRSISSSPTRLTGSLYLPCEHSSALGPNEQPAGVSATFRAINSRVPLAGQRIGSAPRGSTKSRGRLGQGGLRPGRYRRFDVLQGRRGVLSGAAELDVDAEGDSVVCGVQRRGRPPQREDGPSTVG